MLPEGETPLPRYRPVPKPKPGDEVAKVCQGERHQKQEAGTHALGRAKEGVATTPRYQRANDETRDWAIEVGPNDNPYEDPFQARKVAKKERILKQSLKQLETLSVRQAKKYLTV